MENQKKIYFKKGDIVYSQMFGRGEVTSDRGYPIEVLFFGTLRFQFTFDGRYTAKCPVGISKTPLPEIVNTPIVEFTLSFHEAMVELFGNDNKVCPESHPYMVFSMDNEGQLIMDYDNNVHFNCTFNQMMYLSKWRVVE